MSAGISPRHRAGALVAALIAMAEQKGTPVAQKNQIETHPEPNRFSDERKAEAEAKRARKAAKRMQFRHP